MTEEIKGIIEKINKEIKKHIEDGYSEDMLVIYELDVIQWRILLNYITNLQKENENLKQQLDFIDEQNKYIDKIEKMIKDYKSRNKKAIEYIKNINYFDGEISDDIENIPFKYVMDTDIDELLNILQGGDEE